MKSASEQMDAKGGDRLIQVAVRMEVGAVAHNFRCWKCKRPGKWVRGWSKRVGSYWVVRWDDEDHRKCCPMRAPWLRAAASKLLAEMSRPGKN